MKIHCLVTYVEKNGRTYDIDTDDEVEAKRQAVELASNEWDSIISIRAQIDQADRSPKIVTFDSIQCTHDAYRIVLDEEGIERPYCPTCDNYIRL